MSPPIRRHVANMAANMAANINGGLVPWPIGSRAESKTLVVLVTILQLLLVAVVWLLAIVPAGLLALGAMAWKAISGGRGGPGPRR